MIAPHKGGEIPLQARGRRQVQAQSLVLVAAAAAALAGCATNPPQLSRSVQAETSITGVATTPLADANLVKVELPEVLVRAARDPYDPRRMGDCRSLAAEIRLLDEALGPDADRAPPPDGRSDRERAGDAALSVAEVGVKSVIPFRGWIRQISGAARHDAMVDDAILAGATRRGYLKGVGMRLNCAPPASPAWFKPVVVRAAPRPAPAPRPPARR
jgi:hypothetical protein